MNKKVDAAIYGPQTLASMAKLSERDMNFELVDALLKHIIGLDIDGAVLVFLPGWNWIMALHRYLERHPIFG